MPGTLPPGGGAPGVGGPVGALSPPPPIPEEEGGVPPAPIEGGSEPADDLIFAREVYAALEPITGGDVDRGHPLRALVRAVSSMFAQPEEAIRALDDGLDSWERVFDPDRAPLWLLPFVGQAVGVTVDTTLSHEDQVTQIKEEGGWKRGRPASLLAAVAATLTGGKTIRLVERTTPYSALIITRPSETPNATATRNAALSQKPGAMLYTLEQSDLPLIDEGTRTIDASTGTIDTAQLADVT